MSGATKPPPVLSSALTSPVVLASASSVFLKNACDFVGAALDPPVTSRAAATARDERGEHGEEGPGPPHAGNCRKPGHAALRLQELIRRARARRTDADRRRRLSLARAVTRYVPCTRSAVSDAVSPGLIGPVRCLSGAVPADSVSLRSVICCDVDVRLLAISSMAPAPMRDGDTVMLRGVIEALSVIGVGRSLAVGELVVATAAAEQQRQRDRRSRPWRPAQRVQRVHPKPVNYPRRRTLRGVVVQSPSALQLRAFGFDLAQRRLQLVPLGRLGGVVGRALERASASRYDVQATRVRASSSARRRAVSGVANVVISVLHRPVHA